MEFSKFGRALAGACLILLILLYGLTSYGYGVNRLADYKGQVLLYKKSLREGSVHGGTHVYGRVGRYGK